MLALGSGLCALGAGVLWTELTVKTSSNSTSVVLAVSFCVIGLLLLFVLWLEHRLFSPYEKARDRLTEAYREDNLPPAPYDDSAESLRKHLQATNRAYIDFLDDRGEKARGIAARKQRKKAREGGEENLRRKVSGSRSYAMKTADVYREVFRKRLSLPVTRAFEIGLLCGEQDTKIIHEAYSHKQLWEAKAQVGTLIGRLKKAEKECYHRRVICLLEAADSVIRYEFEQENK